MPIYEYECKDCQRTFEKLERTMSSADEPSAKPTTPCPGCGSQQTARKLSVFAAGAGSESSPASEASLPHPGCHCGGGGRCGG